MNNKSLTGCVCLGVALIALLAAYFPGDLHKILILGTNVPILGTALSHFHGIHKYLLGASSKQSTTNKPSTSNVNDRGERLFSTEELSKYNGEQGSPAIYLAILGRVFDVTKGKQHYGPGGGYHAFAGRDASRSFVTGDFSEAGISDDLLGLTKADLKSVQDWLRFYHKDYKLKGKLVGRYYTNTGELTDYHKAVKELIDQALEDEFLQQTEYLQFPPCNVEWTPEKGSRVWCSTRSGGFERGWAGVPRKFYKLGAKTHRCACIEYTEKVKKAGYKYRDGNVEAYKDCHPEADSCYISNEE